MSQLAQEGSAVVPCPLEEEAEAQAREQTEEVMPTAMTRLSEFARTPLCVGACKVELTTDDKGAKWTATVEAFADGSTRRYASATRGTLGAALDAAMSEVCCGRCHGKGKYTPNGLDIATCPECEGKGAKD